MYYKYTENFRNNYSNGKCVIFPTSKAQTRSLQFLYIHYP